MDVIKPEVHITGFTPNMLMDGIMHIEYHIKSFSGECEGYMEIEKEVFDKYVGRVRELVVDELVKDLKGVII